MEFEVKTNLSLMQPQKIESNIAEVKAWLVTALEPYKNMVVSEDAIASAKADRAKVNKVKTALDSKRKAVKKQWLEPYMKWEEEVSELISLCDDTASNLDSQLKSFENQQKEEKKDELKAYFESLASVANVSEYLTFDGVFNPKWLNATVKIETAKEEIMQIVETAVSDIKTILELESEYETTLLLDYKTHRDIRKVLQKKNELESARTAEERRKAAGALNQQGNANIPPKQKNEAVGSGKLQNKAEPQKKEKVYTLRFEVELTKTQMFALKDFFVSNNIEYRKIDN